MPHSIVKELPEPPANRNGWPWTLENLRSPEKLQDSPEFPQISIVTPSYNQGQFIEETIRSVLLQGYPHLDYIIVDGGSIDNSVNIIEQYEPWITYWVSEQDKGQSHAINKGFARATGDLIGWLNSDDLLLPGALEALAKAHLKNPEAILTGNVENIALTDDGWFPLRTVIVCDQTFENFVKFWQQKAVFQQLGLLAPRKAFELAGPLDESLRYVFDWDWMCRLSMHAPVISVGQTIGRFRFHGDSKTVSEGHEFLLEQSKVSKRYWQYLPEGDVDEAAHDRYLTSTFIKRGALMTWYGREDGPKFLWQSVTSNPWASLRVIPDLVKPLFDLSIWRKHLKRSAGKIFT